ncbi:MAG TPA: serine hydrolase domain-containing protein [Alphaproteobacteria bacterium]|nr:serine hydrolase domain-containing protein [Alphaproteobacteria bacterium]
MSKKDADTGFSKKRLKRLTECMAAYVERGEVIGVQTLVHRRGREAHCDVIGWQDDVAKKKLRGHTIFRIASMSKPITSVAALMLIEEGRIRLDDPIDAWIPELADRRVMRDPVGPVEDTYPSPRPITVLDLFTHRSGLPSTLANITGPIFKAMSGLTSGLGLRSNVGVDPWLKKLGELPLVYEPGARMNYGFSTDVLGFLVARASGMSFPEFLSKRLFEPLGMEDTAFFVPQDKLNRLSVNYAIDFATGKRVLDDHPENSRWAVEPSVPSGAGGLVSTADDYMKFARMLLDGGKINGTRILSRKTIDLMTSDFLTPEQRRMPFFGYDMWSGRGFGLGVSIVDNLAGMKELSSIGQYGWGGAFGTWWFNDPREDMAAVMMIQMLFGAATSKIQRDFTTLVYQAIDD